MDTHRGRITISLLLALPVACSAGPVVANLRVLTSQVARHDRFEVAADITGDWANPFDPDQITVNASFTAPSGKRLHVPGFWYQDYAESGPATRVRQQVTGLTLFAYAHEWPEGTKLELFVDDISLLDDQGREVPLDDMEQGDKPRAVAVDGASLELSSELAHGGRRSPRFTTDFPRPSTFAVEVREVCPDARLEIRVDGTPVRTVDLPVRNVPGKVSRRDPTWNIWVCRYDEAYEVEVPAGRHEIEVENTEERSLGAGAGLSHHAPGAGGPPGAGADRARHGAGVGAEP